MQRFGVARASARSTVLTMRPSTTIEMRSHKRSSSSRSEDTTSTPVPARAASLDHAVDFLARADIDADRRFVEQKERRPRMVPFGEDDFLLIAAGQKLDRRRSAGRLDGQAAFIALFACCTAAWLRSQPQRENCGRRGNVRLRSIE